MGGERASTARQRLAGKICCECKSPFDSAPWHGGERRCERCAKRREKPRRVYLSFFAYNSGWTVQFSEVTLDGAIGRVRTFPDEQSIRDLIDRTPTKLDSAAKNSLEYALANGRGGLHLDLTADQYAKLTQ